MLFLLSQTASEKNYGRPTALSLHLKKIWLRSATALGYVGTSVCNTPSFPTLRATNYVKQSSFVDGTVY